MTAAISMANELGVRKVAVPSAGNAAGAMAAYAAPSRNGSVHLHARRHAAGEHHRMPRRPAPTSRSSTALSPTAARSSPNEKKPRAGSTSRRSKSRIASRARKTMGYELFEQFDGKLPDVIIYPTGGGTGLIGMWKAFDEMEQMGWIGSERPRMVTVQSSTCVPDSSCVRNRREVRRRI